MSQINKSIPSFVKGPEKKAFQELFAIAKDGKITTAEARCFAERNRDVFEHGDNRWVRSAVQELVAPDTTYAQSWTPDAELSKGARALLAKVDHVPSFELKRRQ